MGILDEVKSVAKIVQQIDNIELYRKVLELQSEIMELVEQNSSLKKEIESLKKRLDVKDNLVVEEGMYWVQKPDGIKDGPYCTRCWDVEEKLVRLKESSSGYYLCLNCKANFKTRDYKNPGPIAIKTIW